MKKTKLFLFAVLILLTAVMLFSCADKEDASVLDERTERMLSYIVKDDAEGAYALVKDVICREDFDSVHADLVNMLKGHKDYDLEKTRTEVRTSNGKTRVAASYTVKADGKPLFILTSAFIKGEEGIDTFKLSHYSDVYPTGSIGTMKGASVLQWVLVVISVLEIAFVIWMFIDCVKAKISAKPLWAILILMGFVSVTVTFGGGRASLRFLLALATDHTAFLQYQNGMSVLRITVPIAAVLYLILKKKLVRQAEEEAAARAQTDLLSQRNDAEASDEHDGSVLSSEKDARELDGDADSDKQ